MKFDMSRHLIMKLRDEYPDLVKHVEETSGLDMIMANDEVRRIYDEAITKAVDYLAGDFATKVDQTWWEKRLYEGVELNEFVADLKWFSYTGTAYQVVFGNLDDDDFHECEQACSWVFGDLKRAIGYVQEVMAFAHARIYREEVDGNNLPNEGDDMLVYSPHSFGNRTDGWLCRGFDGRMHRLDEHGNMRSMYMTWRMLRDAIDNMPSEHMDDPAYAWAMPEDVTYDGLYLIGTDINTVDDGEANDDNPYSINIMSC